MENKYKVEFVKKNYVYLGYNVCSDAAQLCGAAGADENAPKKAEISGDEFFSVSINAVNGSVEIAGKKLLAAGKELKTVSALNSEIG